MKIFKLSTSLSAGLQIAVTSRHAQQSAVIKYGVGLVLLLLFTVAEAQVRVRLFSGYNPEDVILTVSSGSYSVVIAGDSVVIGKRTPVHISEYDKKIAVKPHNQPGYLCDSVILRPLSDSSSFSLKNLGNTRITRHYTGSLTCYPDLGSVLLVNTSDIEQYVAGVVLTEGGSRQYHEYYKSQAVIARTYMYRYIHRHLADGYNLCDNTHCQAFNGISEDKAILAAAKATHNLVILDSDSLIIYSAFHSNCGGETCASEDVWLTDLPYLKKVIDPYCLKSRNARWQKVISAETWRDYLMKNGFEPERENPAAYDFVQPVRLTHYRAGRIVFPLQVIRSDFSLKSSFFSVKAVGQNITFSGRGYGHGVGLCQEGAMSMASQGFDFRRIIGFYYTGVILADIGLAKSLAEK